MRMVYLLLCAAIWLGGSEVPRLLLFEPTMSVSTNVRRVALCNVVRGITTDSATVLVTSAGHAGYLLDRRCIDLLGKCDTLVARMPDHRYTSLSWFEQARAFRPGHGKWSYEHSVLQLKPDVIAQVWTDIEDYSDEILKHYVAVRTKAGFALQLNGGQTDVILLKKHSRHVKWDVLAAWRPQVVDGILCPDE